ncbi:MAG: hypothetical protein IJH84_16410 [Saccharopolyspora sp.]|uniref:hypothetical protein n=1 Tax=Saccharopolyspora TaxID=1835 RepID=UPI00190D3A12|nr:MULTISPECIES: hypothetical protein [unclassified Saccharopolyspora]MBK0866440.1 hypothetical protein [Saccharopolyspora sp. HNM0986]MBQ6642596.1 hypothetical protein [Saccharopolyspora sp.]
MTSTNNTSAFSPEREQQRVKIRQWGQGTWAEPCDAIFFHWKRFSLSKFKGRQELGTKPFWFRIVWVLALPVLLIYGWIRQGLDDAGLTKEPETKTTPGLISVSGSTSNPAPTSLIDTVKRAPRPLWMVFSHSRLAVVAAAKDESAPSVVWQTDEAASVRFHHAAQNSIEVTWPDRSRVFFYPTIEEREIITGFVRSTWNDPR